MNTLGWILLVLGLLLLSGLTVLIVKFKEKLKIALFKLIELLKKINWVALYEKAQKSGAIDKAVSFIKSRKKLKDRREN